MRPALVTYVVAALVVAGMAGPVSQQVRDASLSEFETVGDPQPLTDYPFLLAVRNHLPPLIVDWVITSRTDGLDIPPGANITVDPEGRYTIVWDDGCEEPYRDGQTARGPDCAPPEPQDPEDCLPHQAYVDGECRDVCSPNERFDAATNRCERLAGDCPPGQVYAQRGEPGGPGCVVDPACAQDPDDNTTRPEGCPEPEPDTPCADGEALAYDDTCARLGATTYLAISRSDAFDAESHTVDAKLPTAPLELVITFTSQGNARLRAMLTDDDRDQTICWDHPNEDGDVCQIDENEFTPSERSLTFTARLDALPDGQLRSNLTLTIEVRPIIGGAPVDASLDLRLEGTTHPNARNDNETATPR